MQTTSKSSRNKFYKLGPCTLSPLFAPLPPPPHTITCRQNEQRQLDNKERVQHTKSMFPVELREQSANILESVWLVLAAILHCHISLLMDKRLPCEEKSLIALLT